MRRVLVTPTTFGKYDAALKSTLEAAVDEVLYNSKGRPLQADELCPLLQGVDGYIAGLDQIDSAVIQSADRLRVIARYGVGVDRVDLGAATRRGVIVTNTPGANAAAVAELAIALMLALARRLPQASQATKRGEWPRLRGVGLRGKTVGLIGLGAIGGALTARLSGFDCQVLSTDPHVQPSRAGQFGVQLVSQSTLLSRSDFVSLHVPALPSTRGMVDRDFLRQMKTGAFLINTARGELIDEAALRSALRDGQLGGAALDCLSQEPPPLGHPLLELPNVILTPHAGSHTDEAANQMGWMSLRACLAVLRGERPEHVVNPEVLE
ncbi:MAG: phosphoglycerate dehydrogenase [Anaerolineales bacterium]|jgi:D-3-phosphoglycerate dehydrogenase